MEDTRLSWTTSFWRGRESHTLSTLPKDWRYLDPNTQYDSAHYFQLAHCMGKFTVSAGVCYVEVTIVQWFSQTGGKGMGKALIQAQQRNQREGGTLHAFLWLRHNVFTQGCNDVYLVARGPDPLTIQIPVTQMSVSLFELEGQLG